MILFSTTGELGLGAQDARFRTSHSRAQADCG